MTKIEDIDLPPARRSLSARLLLLAIVYVMLSEILIYVPSIHRFRVEYLESRLADGHLAVLALDASPDRQINSRLSDELLRHARSDMVVLHGYAARTLMLERRDVAKPTPSDVVDLRTLGLVEGMMQALEDVFRTEPLWIRVVGPSPKDPHTLVESVITTADLQKEIRAFSQRILGLSILISVVTAALIYVTIQILMVRPMLRLTRSMIRFRDAPEDTNRILVPEKRGDEIGIAQRALAELQDHLQQALAHRARLAALGTAMAKVNHDLRNILATVQLVADGLVNSGDYKAAKMAPRLTGAVERAERLVEQTLEFARGTPATLQRRPARLKNIIERAYGELAPALRDRLALDDHTSDGDIVAVDVSEVGRIFVNLARNAAEAGATIWTVTAEAVGPKMFITCRDNGPGIPIEARPKLFEPFSRSSKAGSMGLGMVIARDIARAHGGDLMLDAEASPGAVFKVILPAALTT